MSKSRLSPFLRGFRDDIHSGIEELPRYRYPDLNNPMPGYYALYSSPFQLGEGWFYKRALIHANLEIVSQTFGPYSDQAETDRQLELAIKRDNA